MPLSATPSDRSTKLWGTLAHVPLRIDFTILVVSFFTLLFSLSTAVYGIGRDTGYDSRYPPTTDTIAAVLAIGIVTPLTSMLVAFISIYLHSSAALAPGLAVAISVILFAGWAGGILFLWILYIISEEDYQDHGAIQAARIVQFIGALVEVVLYITYLVYSAIAVHRLRRRTRSGGPVAARSDLELQSTDHLNSNAEPK